jgi:hypothetical protein
LLLYTAEPDTDTDTEQALTFLISWAAGNTQAEPAEVRAARAYRAHDHPPRHRTAASLPWR